MTKYPRGFKTMFKRHIDRCKHKKLVNDLKEPKDFLEWVLSGRKAKCYLCQADLSSTSAAGPQSKMMDRRNSKATNGNCKEDHTSVTDASTKRASHQKMTSLARAVRLLTTLTVRRQLGALRLVQLPLSNLSSLGVPLVAPPGAPGLLLITENRPPAVVVATWSSLRGPVFCFLGVCGLWYASASGRRSSPGRYKLYNI
jgi:hypothetical protein